MPTKAPLRKVPITRKDGVATHVWKRDDDTDSNKRRIGNGAPPVAPQNTLGSPVDMALSFDPHNIEPMDEPVWWDEFVAESADGEPGFTSTPELLDIIPSPVGDLAVVWQPSSMERSDKSAFDGGYSIPVMYFKHVDTGEVYGFLKSSSMTDESFDRSFGTDEFMTFRHRARQRGAHYPLMDFDGWVDPFDHRDGSPVPTRPDDLVELKREIWASAHRDTGMSPKDAEGKYIASYNVSKDVAPHDEAVLDKDLNVFRKRFMKEIKDQRSYLDPKSPFIDFSRVEDELKGKGFGSAMYVYVAKRLGVDGAMLRASGVQTEFAQALWKRMKKNMGDHYTKVEITGYGETTKYKALDFRS